MKEVDEFEAKIKRMEKLKIRTNELGCDKLKSDLNFEKVLEIDRIKRVETTPKKILIQLKIKLMQMNFINVMVLWFKVEKQSDLYFNQIA